MSVSTVCGVIPDEREGAARLGGKEGVGNKKSNAEVMFEVLLQMARQLCIYTMRVGA